ncbi:alanine/glycine:cation symporter family protein [Kocuria sp. CPCC 205263]|uniref:alanine/glycine:cation symporter family protein n=1 Tax=Kocuria sp. CPCC 205263 TaxID=3073555 RepID=UPI0034D39528
MVDQIYAIGDKLWLIMLFMAMPIGVYLTVRTRFLQVRLFKDMIRQLKGDGKDHEGGLTPFQALSLTIGNRVGVGNIAGVATAIGFGGPGALFWMAVMAFFGGATAFVESTLAQIYKQRIDGELQGGVPYYLEKITQKRWLGVVAAVTALTLYTLLAPGVQATNIGVAAEFGLNMPTWVTGLIVTAVLGAIIWGGRRRVLKFVNVAVPIMAAGYILMTVLVLAFNITQVPAAIGLIFSSAFGADSVYGGIIGAAIAWGVRRALFSNVAGVGEGTYAAGAADVSHPAKQGLVQAFSIYIDTLGICMATGLMLVVTGKYNVITADGTEISTNLPGVAAGPNFTQEAVATVWQPAAGPFIAIAIALFALTTIVAFYFIAEANLAYLVGHRNPVLVRILEVAILAVTFYSTISDAGLVWATADIGYGALGILNFTALIFVSGIAIKTLKDYDQQRKAGLDPVFDPTTLGIKHATFWEELNLNADIAARRAHH